MSESDLQIIAEENEVRRIADLSEIEYSDLDLEHALEYGSAIVRRETGVKTWVETDPLKVIAVEAANMFAASILFPRTSRDERLGMKSYYSIYQDNGYNELKKLNLGRGEETDSESSNEYFKIINSPDRNYYKNNKVKPYMAKDGFMGGYNDSNNPADSYTLETL